MAQDRIAIDNFNAVQPVTFDWRFETTSTEDSGRPMSGNALITPLFTVEAFTVEYRKLTAAQAAAILQAIVQRPSKPYFQLHYYSPYYGTWRTGTFYVGQGSLKVKRLVEGNENMENISCDFVGRDKLV